ncbi:O-antigen ligase family protein [Marinagarivorans algicola]|uniref:O-antigen ligase family protein n=1 Tax=Marinagarivorans algicola TaxID=1513270 RepID=UPI0006B8B06C|nr:O-antigen ligase family protein [Marinagarivorans algicola]
MSKVMAGMKSLCFTKPWLLYWCFFSALVSTVHHSQLYYQHDAPKWWLLDVALSIFVTVRIVTERANITLHIKGCLCLSVLILCGLSVFWAPNFGAAIELFLRYSVLAVALYFLIKDIQLESYSDLPFWVAFTSSCSFFVVLVIERYLLGLPYSHGAYTPLGFINHAGQVYIFWIPLLFLGTIKYTGWIRYGSLILLMASALILAESAVRASLLGLTGAIVLLAIVFLLKHKQKAWQAVALLGVLLCAVFIVQYFGVKGDYLAKKLERTVSASSFNRATSNRVGMFKNTAIMIADNPLGVGLNNFEYIHPLYAKAGTSQASAFVSERRILRTPHNFLLKITSEIGWLGGVLFLILGIWVGVIAVRSVWVSNGDTARGNYWAPAYCIAILALLFNALFSAVFSNPGSLWFSLILLAAIGALAQVPARPLCVLPLVSSVRCLMCVTAIFLMALSCASFVSQRLAYQGKKEYDPLKLERAININAYNERARYDYAVITYEQNRDTQSAIDNIQQFLMINPYHIGARFKLAQWLYQQKEYDRCKAELQNILRYYPKYKAAKNLYRQASRQ